jgi:hypothetical protein
MLTKLVYITVLTTSLTVTSVSQARSVTLRSAIRAKTNELIGPRSPSESVCITKFEIVETHQPAPALVDFRTTSEFKNFRNDSYSPRYMGLALEVRLRSLVMNQFLVLIPYSTATRSPLLKSLRSTQSWFRSEFGKRSCSQKSAPAPHASSSSRT